MKKRLFFESLKDNARNDEELANINHNLGNSLLKENKIDLAIEAYKTSLRINPNDEDTRYNLAYAQKMKQQQQQIKNNSNNIKKQQQDQKEQQQDQKEQQQDQKNSNKIKKSNNKIKKRKK